MAKKRKSKPAKVALRAPAASSAEPSSPALDEETRLKLCCFACSFAWADLKIHPQEREHILHGLVRRLRIDESDRPTVAAWLKSPPSPDELDPMEIPRELRQLFIQEAEDVIRADGVIHPEETAAIKLLRAILFGDAAA